MEVRTFHSDSLPILHLLWRGRSIQLDDLFGGNQCLLGRNQTLYDFWFYITNFSRYPMEIYSRGWGLPLYFIFTFVIPVLVVVNVPARLLAQPLTPRADWEWPLAALPSWRQSRRCSSVAGFFNRSLLAYRSASS